MRQLVLAFKWIVKKEGYVNIRRKEQVSLMYLINSFYIVFAINVLSHPHFSKILELEEATVF